MPILTLQKRARSLGRIRIGQVVPTSNGKTRPEKLDRFRLTSPSKVLLDKAAALYGGTVEEWTPQGGGPTQWEVITDSRRIPIMVPPQPVTQFLESWGRGHCTHRCDGYTNFLTGEPCDPDDPLHIDARPTTRLNVVLRDVEGIGVWRLESKGWNAAMELPDSADFLAQAGGYVEGWLSLEERTSVTVVNDKVQTRRFMVPIIEIDVTPAELMAGRGRVATPALDGPVPQTPAQLEAPAAVVNPYVGYHRQVEAAGSLDELAAVWDKARGENLVGPTAAQSPDALAFVEAFKARAQAVKPAEEPGAAPTAEPDEDGAYPAEVVEDAAASVGAEDPEAIWQQILKVGGERGVGLSALTADFSEQMGGLDPATASAAELRHYLGLLGGQGAAA